MNVEIRTEAAQFPFWEYFVPIFGQLSLQCELSFVLLLGVETLPHFLK
jgi:hypothetical protein